MYGEFCEVYAPSNENNNKKKEIIDKTTIDLNMGISKANGEEFTREEVEQFLNDYIEWIESKGLLSGAVVDFIGR